MQRPPYGITGFYYYLDPPPPSTDESAFLNHCYAFARTLAAKIVRVDRRVGTTEKNFTSVTFETKSDAFAILFNAHYPMLAFAEPMFVGEVIAKFIDRPEYAIYWNEIGGYAILSHADLTIPPHKMELVDMSDSEYDQILVHNPSTSGEIIFNFWD